MSVLTLKLLARLPVELKCLIASTTVRRKKAAVLHEDLCGKGARDE